MHDRRDFLKQTPSLLGLLLSIPALCNATRAAPKTILLRSSWQTVNIGDIGHTPGVLTLLEKYLPNVSVRLWASDVGDGVEEMLNRRFPNVRIFTSSNADAIKAAFAECDFMLHGSSAYLVASRDLARWSGETGKAYGVYGITMIEDRTTPDVIDVLTKARFAFFRDSVSLALAKEKGAKCPVMAFGPDGAFGVDLRNDAAAEAYMQQHGLEAGNFLCVIPRYRNFPAWRAPMNKVVLNQEAKNARNEAMKEHDQKPLREAIIAVVRQTPMKVLICPEDLSQMELGKSLLYDPLPDDVKKKVVLRETFWLTDEALSTYVRSAGLFGNEMHSPIMCIGNGIPAIVCRFAEQTSKGLMWRDIGLGEWLFDLDVEGEIAGIVPAVLAMANDPKAAKANAVKAQKVVQKHQRDTMAVLKTNLLA